MRPLREDILLSEQVGLFSAHSQSPNLSKQRSSEEALQILLKTDYKKLKDKSFYYVNLGALYYHFNEIKKSIFYARKAVSEAKFNSNKKSLLTAYNLIAVNYSYNKDYKNN